MSQSAKPLFILEMANNHMGEVAHGLRIIRELNDATSEFRKTFDFAFKFQYRQLETFIHPDHRQKSDYKYVKRFSETRLDPAQFLELKQEAVSLGFMSVCTPFDEPSVELIEQHGYGIIKIASCSFTDWPLLERIARSDRPIIASTAGVSLDDIDRVVSFFQHRQKDISLMHCVAEYPTKVEDLQLNQIDLFRARFIGVRIGFSTHEPPTDVIPVQLAIAKGASIFEKHVGVPTDRFKLNDYSANPEQIRQWVKAARRAYEMCGTLGTRPAHSSAELESLHGLRRGVFAVHLIAMGRRIREGDFYLAIPTTPGQVTANDLSKYAEFTALREIPANAPVLNEAVARVDRQEKLYGIIKRVKALARESGVQVPRRLDLEISHHYGIDQFEEYGATIVSFVNREYCKKLIFLLPGQAHPEQHHKVKEETFQILYGRLRLTLNGDAMDCDAGDIVTIERGTKHAFHTQNGVVIEEISSTHDPVDSYYTDESIHKNERKTLITHWFD